MSRRAIAPVLAFVHLALFAQLGGCASTPVSQVDPLGAAPHDFALEVTILAGSEVEPQPEAHLRASRYVLFADGSLHYGEDAEKVRTPYWLPPLARILSRQQIADVWSLAQQAGFTDPSHGEQAYNVDVIDVRPSQRVYAATFRGEGERWNFVIASPANSNGDPAMTRLVRQLAQLAWVSDLPQREIMIVPKRYDLGPDPYERYRSQNN